MKVNSSSEQYYRSFELLKGIKEIEIWSNTYTHLTKQERQGHQKEMQQSSAANIKRREKDVMRLMMSGKFQVHLPNEDSTQEFEVLIAGPEDSPYHGGLWCVKVQLPDMYPYKSPSIGFKNRIYHPNIDEASGSVCLDVINQTWSPMYDLINIFDIFLPQLLLYPNPTDPLNPEAAQM